MSGNVVEPSGRVTPRTTTERQAECYRPDPALDRLLAQLERDPSLDAKIAPILRMRLGFYRQAKAAADELAAGGQQ